LYVNGVLQTKTVVLGDPENNSLATNTETFSIGERRVGNWNFPGQIDDLRIYNRPLSSSEVSRLYDWAPGPVGWWKFDERIGTSANDSSGNANTGTLTNGPQWVSGKIGQGLSFDGATQYTRTSDSLEKMDIRSVYDESRLKAADL
jgi:hypothetical protein